MKTGTWHRKAVIAANVIVAIAVVQSAAQILFTTPERKRLFAKAAFPFPTFLFAAFDVGLLALFLVPATRKAGFLLGMCYYSAALATRLATRDSAVEPLLILVLLSTAMFISHPKVFFGK